LQPDNIFMTINRDFHKRQRRLVSPAFSIQFIASLESYMLSVVGRLFDKMELSLKETSKFDLGNGFQNLVRFDERGPSTTISPC
jgi:cytochrome P450